MSGQNVLQGLGRLALKGFIWQTGVWLADYARHLCTLNIQSLPLMRSKSGSIRKTLDPVNRMILLHKLRKEKVHRTRVASTHGELVPEQSAMMKYESYIECALYQKSMQETLGARNRSVWPGTQAIMVERMCWFQSSTLLLCAELAI